MRESDVADRAREYHRRLAAIRDGMLEHGVDAMFLMQPTNVWYVSDFWEFIPIRLEAVLVPRKDDPVFLVSKNEYQYARLVSWIPDIRYYTEFPEAGRRQDRYELVGDVVREKGLANARVGVEERFMPIGDRGALAATLDKGELCDAQVVMQGARMIKSPFEIDRLKKTGEVAIAAWKASWQAAEAGVPEYRIAQEARRAATETAASFFTDEDRHHSPLTDGVQLIQSGPRTSISHGRGSVNRLKQGDMVAMCFCMTNQFKGYRVGFSRNFAMGRPTREMQDVYRLLYDAQAEVLENLRPGARASELDRLVRERICGAGYGEYIEHRLGRGVGLDIAEAPELKEGDNTLIEAGMTLSIEPAVYIPDRWGIQIEDSVHVTSSGWEYLTESATPELPVVGG